MKTTSKLAAATALITILAAPVFAQGTLVGTTALDDRIDDVTTQVNRDMRRGEDAQRFGPLGVPQGWRGSVALSASATDGNTDNGDISMAGRLTYGTGTWVHLFGVAAEYGRTGSTTTDEEFFATYEANRYFTDRFYAFGIGRYQYDSFATNEHDAFLGFGPGVRLINTPNHTWRIQAGPGVRYSQTAAGVDETEVSAIISSRYYYKFTEGVSLTNDTDVLGSESSTLATNDLGLNFKMTDMMSTRVSYRTDYNSDPAPGFSKYDNKLGLSLVVGF